VFEDARLWRRKSCRRESWSDAKIRNVTRIFPKRETQVRLAAVSQRKRSTNRGLVLPGEEGRGGGEGGKKSQFIARRPGGKRGGGGPDDRGCSSLTMEDKEGKNKGGKIVDENQAIGAKPLTTLPDSRGEKKKGERPMKFSSRIRKRKDRAPEPEALCPQAV